MAVDPGSGTVVELVVVLVVVVELVVELLVVLVVLEVVEIGPALAVPASTNEATRSKIQTRGERFIAVLRSRIGP